MFNYETHAGAPGQGCLGLRNRVFDPTAFIQTSVECHVEVLIRSANAAVMTEEAESIF